MPRLAAHSAGGATLPRALTQRRQQQRVLQPTPPGSRSSPPASMTLGARTATTQQLAHAARQDSGQPVSTSSYSTTTMGAAAPSTNASTSGVVRFETARDFGMSQDDCDSVRSSPARVHRPGPPPTTPPMTRRGYSDETPAGRIKHAQRSPTFPSRHRGKARAGTDEQDDCADDADDEQQLPKLTTPRHRKRTSKEEVTSPSRKHRFKRLITKGSKLSLNGAARGESVISSPSQELCMPPLGAYKATPMTPPREISSPISSYSGPPPFPRRASPMMSPPTAFDFSELWPQGQLGSRSQYGFDVPQTASPGRAEKAAQILGEEVKATGKAARVLGIEQKALPETKSSAASLPPRVSSPSSSERSLRITLSTPRPQPTTPNSARHDRQRSLSGPAAFASLEIPLTSTEEGNSSLATEASCSLDDTHVCFHFRTPATDANEDPTSKAFTSSGMGLGLGLATPPPSPPSVPLRPLEAGIAGIDDDAPYEDAQLSRGPNRSKVASVASSTYAPSVYEGSDDVGVPNRHRLTLDSIRFSSAFEGVTSLSTSSGNGSQSQHSLPATRSTVTNPSVRSSLQPQVVQRSLQHVGQRPALASRSSSTPALPKSRGDSGVDERKLSSNGGSHSPARPSSPFRSESEPAGVPQSRTLQSTPKLQPERMSIFGSVASARTKNLQRLDALAALEGHPRLPTLGSPPRFGNQRLSDGDGAPSHPPPQGGLPPLPSILTPPTSPPHASCRPDDPFRTFRNSESFLDFGISSSGDEEDSGDQHRLSQPWSYTDSDHQGRSPPDVPDEVSVLSTRFSTLPLRQLELPRRQLATANGVRSGSGKPFLRGLEMPRSRSTPLLRLETSREALQPDPSSPLSELVRKGPSRTLESILSLSSEGEDDEGSGEDLTSAFPHPPVIES